MIKRNIPQIGNLQKNTLKFNINDLILRNKDLSSQKIIKFNLFILFLAHEGYIYYIEQTIVQAFFIQLGPSQIIDII